MLSRAGTGRGADEEPSDECKLETVDMTPEAAMARDRNGNARKPTPAAIRPKASAPNHMITLEKIEFTKDELRIVLHHFRCTFVTTRALQSIRDEWLAQLKHHLLQHLAAQVLSIPNSLAHPFRFIRTGEAHIFSSVETTLAVWENAPEFMEAEKMEALFQLRPSQFIPGAGFLLLRAALWWKRSRRTDSTRLR